MRRKFKKGSLGYGCDFLEIRVRPETKGYSSHNKFCPIPCKHAYDVMKVEETKYGMNPIYSETYTKTTWKVPFSVYSEHDDGGAHFCGLCLKEAVDETAKALGLEDGAPSSRTQPRKI